MQSGATLGISLTNVIQFKKSTPTGIIVLLQAFVIFCILAACVFVFFFFVVSDSLFTDDTLSLAYEVKTKPERKELQAK